MDNAKPEPGIMEPDKAVSGATASTSDSPHTDHTDEKGNQEKNARPEREATMADYWVRPLPLPSRPLSLSHSF